jgi:integrase/recombinase XerD
MPCILFSDAVNCFLLERRAAHYSPHTLADYSNTYRLFVAWRGDCQLDEITTQQIAGFLASRPVSGKTALNYHTALSALWHWAVDNAIADLNVVRKIPPPRAIQKVIIGYTRADIVALIDAAGQGKNPARDRAIILLLLDCGIRESELIGLRLGDVSLPSRSLIVCGKGGVERRLVYSSTTGLALEIWLNHRDHAGPGGHLFITTGGHPFRRDTLVQLLQRLGRRAGVSRCNAHRFRHTFAIQFLRNGGNIFTLQRMLGHTSLDMVKRYLAISQIDLERDHARASPVANWEL